MSRADQSLTSATPKTWPGASATLTGWPGREARPTTKPTSSSMSSRVLGPNTMSPEPSRRCPAGRGTGVPDTTIVPARPW